MWSLQDEIDQAIVSLNLRGVWWHSLKQPTEVYPFEGDGYKYLSSFLKPNVGETYWFIPELDEESSTDLQVYEAQLESIITVIEECPPFEYYIVNKNKSLLLIENDHNEIIISTRET